MYCLTCVVYINIIWCVSGRSSCCSKVVCRSLFFFVILLLYTVLSVIRLRAFDYRYGIFEHFVIRYVQSQRWKGQLSRVSGIIFITNNQGLVQHMWWYCSSTFYSAWLLETRPHSPIVFQIMLYLVWRLFFI